MAEMTKEEIAEMVNSTINAAIAPMVERFNSIDGKETKEEKEEEPEVSEAVKQYVEAKQNGMLSGRSVEAPNNRSYLSKGAKTKESVLTGKEI